MSTSLIPAPANAQVWIDFDGTITQQDVLDELIQRFATDDSWKQTELEWQQGLIGSRECLTRQLATVRITDAEIDRFIKTISLDPGTVSLVQLLHRQNVPAMILSDGLDRFIMPLLQQAGLNPVPANKIGINPSMIGLPLRFRCNSVERTDKNFVLRCPYADAGCTSGSAHCKCKSIQNESMEDRQGIYIGDGRSDLCPSKKISCRFAKGVLAMNLEREQLDYLPFENLGQVTSILATAWGGA